VETLEQLWKQIVIEESACKFIDEFYQQICKQEVNTSLGIFEKKSGIREVVWRIQGLDLEIWWNRMKSWRRTLEQVWNQRGLSKE